MAKRKVSDVYGSRYLRTEDIPAEGLFGKIVEIGTEPFTEDNGKKRDKITLRLDTSEKPVVVNSTNAFKLAQKWGEEFEDWLGDTLQISQGTTAYNGRQVACMVFTALDVTDRAKTK